MKNRTVIRIGGAKCKLEDMPLSFQEAVKRGTNEEGIEEDMKVYRDIEKLKVTKVEKVTKVKKIAEVSIYRKMFGYRSGMFD